MKKSKIYILDYNNSKLNIVDVQYSEFETSDFISNYLINLGYNLDEISYMEVNVNDDTNNICINNNDLIMDKHTDIKCFFGLHKYNVYKEEIINDKRGEPLAKIIISRCKNCGKIKLTKVDMREI